MVSPEGHHHSEDVFKENFGSFGNTKSLDSDMVKPEGLAQFKKAKTLNIDLRDKM